MLGLELKMLLGLQIKCPCIVHLMTCKPRRGLKHTRTTKKKQTKNRTSGDVENPRKYVFCSFKKNGHGPPSLLITGLCSRHTQFAADRSGASISAPVCSLPASPAKGGTLQRAAASHQMGSAFSLRF